jgi:hypothetical protein
MQRREADLSLRVLCWACFQRASVVVGSSRRPRFGIIVLLAVTGPRAVVARPAIVRKIILLSKINETVVVGWVETHRLGMIHDARRYWEHTLRDERDFARHADYIHFSPAKHGLVTRVSDWPHSSFSRMVRLGVYPAIGVAMLPRRAPVSAKDDGFRCAQPILRAEAALARSRFDFSATFATIAFDDSSLRWLDINT